MKRQLVTTRLVIGTSRTVGSANKFVRITSGFGGGEFTKTLRKFVNVRYSDISVDCNDFEAGFLITYRNI
jgi:hypothetical protein